MTCFMQLYWCLCEVLLRPFSVVVVPLVLLLLSAIKMNGGDACNDVRCTVKPKIEENFYLLLFVSGGKFYFFIFTLFTHNSSSTWIFQISDVIFSNLDLPSYFTACLSLIPQ